MKDIIIVRGNDTKFNDGNLCTIHINSGQTSLAGYSASFSINTITLVYNDISSGEFNINLTSSQSRRLQLGRFFGNITLYDDKNQPKLMKNIPFKVVDVLPTLKAEDTKIKITIS